MFVFTSVNVAIPLLFVVALKLPVKVAVPAPLGYPLNVTGIPAPKRLPDASLTLKLSDTELPART